MAAVLFGTGEVLKGLRDVIDFEQILCLADNSVKKQHTFLYGKKIIAPEEIKQYDFSSIVIFSTKNFFEIYKQLVNDLQIPESKVFSWYFYAEKEKVSIEKKQMFSAWRSVEGIISCMRLKNLKTVLDFGQQLGRYDVLNRQDTRLCGLDGEYLLDSYKLLAGKRYASSYNLYEHIYTRKGELMNQNYDAILFLNSFFDMKLEDCKEHIRQTYLLSEYIILNIPWQNNGRYKHWTKMVFQEFGQVEVVANAFSCFLMIKKHRQLKNTVKVYVVTHKKFTLPKGKIYIPIHAGSQNKAGYGYIRDDTGENISSLNPWINECTALYWMWKHVHCQYIGLNHYRRYLLKDKTDESLNNILDEDVIRDWLKKYDVLVARAECSYPDRTVNKVLFDGVMRDAYDIGMKIVKNLLIQRQPEYVDAFDMVMLGMAFYPCNMFVMKKAVLDVYCEWLFSFITDAASFIDISKYDDYSKRIIGFIAERMLTVWLMHHQLRVRECPVLLIS
ncbi:DUF4422 domain-containing protein [Propionispira raffinosivorans]|uniref:DUF4422 domain-containing protein n=1 Tax=Propionispira raffinosivorans TaxID=86959 RepID=UPI000375284E|nr:DUF4422 domain-containing protein [Propionispira raffinosivorans]